MRVKDSLNVLERVPREGCDFGRLASATTLAYLPGLFF
jgi:hypothetical protein